MPYVRKIGLFSGILAMLAWVAGCVAPMPKQEIKRWAAYYGKAEDWRSFQHLDVVVFDADQHPPIAPLKAHGVKVLAYLSVAEIAPYRSFSEEMLAMPDFVIGRQPQWNASIVDIRNPVWREHMLVKQLPAIIAQGFDGVMIDTLDSALAQYALDPARFAGTREAAIQLIRDIRQNIPASSLIMVNRGFDIAPDIADKIDILLAESIMVDARQQPFQLFEKSVYLSHVERLQQLQRKNAHLSIFTLDYFDTGDMNARQDIECTQRSHGFSPYVATLDLQQFRPAALKQC